MHILVSKSMLNYQFDSQIILKDSIDPKVLKRFNLIFKSFIMHQFDIFHQFDVNVINIEIPAVLFTNCGSRKMTLYFFLIF